jgi:hypothetical protein
LVTWSVDRARASPWFGKDEHAREERMQVIKALAFTARDWVLRTFGGNQSQSDAEKEVAEEIGNVGSGAAGPVSFTDPEIGWPPARITPVHPAPLPGEGAWIALDKDPFITHTPGAPPAFLTTFIRPDKTRLATRIYITLWDPRQIALHMEAGTVEPVSAAGEAGPGVIPRTPEVMRRVVAGFNGGFQAMHGEFGMQANGILYLPPKPYAATIVEMRDGSTAFGAWPAAPDVPDDILSYRQNLTALVQNDKFNPWGRVWWGGTPKGWADNIHTTRSGICLTKENFVAYFWGNELSPDVLASTMLMARCAFGVHLDMNPGLAGFEFYNVAPASQWQPLGRPIQSDWEYEGQVRELPEFKFRARRMLKTMQEQNFPQYIHRDARDFFYLTARYVLPGAELPGPAQKQPGEGAWRTKGLPQHGFPYAIATSWTQPDAAHPEVKVRVLRVDPRTVRPAGSVGTSEETPTVVSFASGSAGGHDDARGRHPAEVWLWLASGVFIVGSTAPAPDAMAIVSGVPASHAPAARVAVGIHDEDGMLDWVELAPDSTADDKTAVLLDKLLQQTGCSSRMVVPGDARAILGNSLDIVGEPAAPWTGAASRLVRGPAPGAHPIFESTPIVGPNVWQPLQNQRVRYFRKPAKAAAPDAGAPKAPDTASDQAASASATIVAPVPSPPTSASAKPR